MIWSEIVFEEK